MKVIDEKTVVPISFIIILASGIFWLTSLYSEVKANQAEIKQLRSIKQTQSKMFQEQIVLLNQQLTSINTRLSKIEGRLMPNN